MLLTIVMIVTLLALGTFLLVNSQPVKEVARWIAGVGSIVWAVLILFSLA